MKLEPPLACLVDRCKTMCVAECCGVDAYDFSPIHIASYLTMYRGEIDALETRILREQLKTLRVNFGMEVTGGGVSFDDMNASFSATEVNSWVNEILFNLDVALKLVEISDAQRWKSAKPGSEAIPD